MLKCIRVYTMGKTKVIPVRMSVTLYNYISDFAAFYNLKKSEGLRILIKEGLLKKSYIGLIKQWQEKIKYRDPLISNVKNCEKCGRIKENLKFYHIDGNIRNLNPENLIILCDGCLTNLQRFIQKYNPIEKFAAWFSYEEP